MITIPQLTAFRFDIMRGGGKLNKTVAYREKLDLSRVLSPSSEDTNAEYELYGVIVHYGTTIFSGHYVAFIKIDSQWLLFDDNQVTTVPASTVLKQNAYILFYQKVQAGKRTQTAKIAASVKANKSSSDQIGNEVLYISYILIPIEIASTSAATFEVEKAKYRVYVKNNENVVEEIFVKLEVPRMVSKKTKLT
jgi:hypothetical protein